MSFKIGNRNKFIINNRLFLTVTILYMSVLLIFSFISCFFSFRQRKESVLSEINVTYMQLEQAYNNIVDNFWQVYMPIFENKNEVYDIFDTYFSSNSSYDLSPIEKRTLVYALKQLLGRNNQIQWVALYSEDRQNNYVLFRTGSGLLPLSDAFPYQDKLNDQNMQMNIYGMKLIESGDSLINTYAISGGVPFNMGDGRIIVGYSPTSFEQICNEKNPTLKSLKYLLTTNNEIIFKHEDNSSRTTLFLPTENYSNVIKTEGDLLYVHAKFSGHRSSMLSYQFSQKELFLYSHHNTPIILLIVVVFGMFSIFIYMMMLNHLSKEVSVIQQGLTHIGENQLEYRIPTNFLQRELAEIATAINNMTVRLNENINRAYRYEIKQKEAELAELQSKFNPHFLYNSLEMIRSRCHQSGDEPTADLVTQLAAIFRGFISPRTFIPLSEELAFSKRYLTLFGARYKDQVEILYDIDTEILRYGTIRNIYQPLIENYFVHGFETTAGKNNYICFRGKSLDEHTMLLTVEDNGMGITDEILAHLMAKLNEPIKMDTESYGLKNLHQRLQLFYGSDCGLTIVRNKDNGLSIQMKILKITYEDYNNSAKSVS